MAGNRCCGLIMSIPFRAINSCSLRLHVGVITSLWFTLPRKHTPRVNCWTNDVDELSPTLSLGMHYCLPAGAARRCKVLPNRGVGPTSTETSSAHTREERTSKGREASEASCKWGPRFLKGAKPVFCFCLWLIIWSEKVMVWFSRRGTWQKAKGRRNTKEGA